jgi:hypothetical protein
MDTAADLWYALNVLEHETHALLRQIIDNQKELYRLMAGQNTTIQQIAGDVTKFVGDFTALSAAVKAFLASLATGSGGTTLSTADQAALNALDPIVQAADASAQALAASIPATGVGTPAPGTTQPPSA